ncbi:hypothetical protein AKJ47_01140 [candidate division MSBL1 archaeon SCGC-AAA261G05]|uniref:Uncharacterized protein n=4 Tax=candidate division MSBL1 TaxID=215777 RepID=A0A133V0B4_9EURY|nr:hypothetical protein AKJ42_02345 [candidate division MSBL1 archaeon SCGC-AAA261C02]KXB03271.1 hypothetical protein AKJ48_04045 [candidate division MSBL1 archaeon SCGC-AAA261O19]KXB03986.1 hypothetical protein AKJ47_01140 [candidate division MSBL1 archaeon SCGC-AAA261G05]
MVEEKLEKSLSEFLENGDDWERKPTSVRGVFVLKLPKYKGSPPRLAAEVNPVDSRGNPTKKRGLLIRNPVELKKFRDLIKEEGLDGLLNAVDEVNPGPSKEVRPEEEEEVIEI